jgi:hypothetical protein
LHTQTRSQIPQASVPPEELLALLDEEPPELLDEELLELLDEELLAEELLALLDEEDALVALVDEELLVVEPLPLVELDPPPPELLALVEEVLVVEDEALLVAELLAVVDVDVAVDDAEAPPVPGWPRCCEHAANDTRRSADARSVRFMDVEQAQGLGGRTVLTVG